MTCISHISFMKVRNGSLNKWGRKQYPVKKWYITGLPTQLLHQNFGVVIHPFWYKGTSFVWSKLVQMGLFPAENLISNSNLFNILYGFLSVCERECHEMSQLLQLILDEWCVANIFLRYSKDKLACFGSCVLQNVVHEAICLSVRLKNLPHKLVSLFGTIGISAMVVAISGMIMFVRYGEQELCWLMFGWVAPADSVSQISHLVTIHPFFTECDA